MDDSESLPASNAIEERLLISYDVARARTRTRGKVHRRVFGHESRKAVNGHIRTYRYHGLLSDPRVEYIGQSVLLLPRSLGEAFLRFLRQLEVPCSSRTVYIPRRA